MIPASDVSACIVTRGDVPLGEVVESLAGFREIIVWDNSFEHDYAVMGRYVALGRCLSEIVYVQDDDAVLHPSSFTELLAHYNPSAVTANMPARFRPHYSDSCLVGFGGLFRQELATAAFVRFESWVRAHVGDLTDDELEASGRESMRRTADIVFTGLTPRVLIDVPYRDLPWAHADNRMWKQPGHVGERQRMLELVRRVRDE